MIPANATGSATIPHLARKASVPRRTMYWRLMLLHGQDRQRPGFEPWLYRFAGGPWRVNLSRLRAAHPELFDVPSNEDLDERLRTVETRVRHVEEGHHALRRRVQRLAEEVGR